MDTTWCRWVITVATVGAAVGWGCSSRDSDDIYIEVPEYGTGFTDMGIDGDTVGPLQVVYVQGMPDDMTPTDLYAEWWSGAGPRSPSEAPILIPLFPDEAGNVYLMTPLVDPDGGPASMAFTDGERWSPVHTLQMDPLPPPREGALDEVVAAVDDLLRAATETLGYDYPGTWERYRDAELSDLPPTEFPLFRAWSAMVDPQNERSLAQRSTDADVRVLFERLMAAMPLAEAMQEQAAWIDRGESLLHRAYDPSELVFATSGSVPSSGSGGITPVSNGDDEAYRIEVASLPIDGPEELAALLEEYREAVRRQRNLELFEETVGAYIKTVVLGLSLAAGPAGFAGRAKLLKAYETLMNLISAIADVSAMSRWFLPCCIEEMVVQMDPPDAVVLEDAEANQLRMVGAAGRVESEGVDFVRELAERVLAKGLSSALGPGPGHDLNEEVAKALSKVTEEIAEYTAEQLVEQYIGTLPRQSKMVFVWENTDLAGDEPTRWLEAEVDAFHPELPRIVARDTDADGFEFSLITPQAWFTTDSFIRFSTNYDELPANTATHTVRVDLRHIEVDFSPSIAFVGEGDVIIPFEIEVRNSVLPEPAIADIMIEPEVGTVQPAELERIGNTLYFEYLIPDEFPDDTIVEISTRSTSQGGIRTETEDATLPPRTGAMFLTKERVHIDVYPPEVCMEEGETQQFEALAHLTGAPVDAIWEAPVGHITEHGLYTAPGDLGETFVTASPEADALSESTARVLLDQCECFWSARVGPPISAMDARAGIHGGISLRFDEEDQVFTGIYFSGDDTHVDVPFEPPIPVNEEGPTVTTARLLSPRVGGESFNMNEVPPLTVRIDRRAPFNDPYLHDYAVAMEGNISGTVTTSDILVIDDEVVRKRYYAGLDLDFSASFTFQPLSFSQLNCQPP